MDQTSVPATSSTQNPPAIKKNYFARLADKFKAMPKKQKMLWGAGIAVLLVLILGWFIYSRNNSSKTGSSEVIIASVGNTQIPETYLDMELQYYPASNSAETKKLLTEKLINDEITLQYGVGKGIVEDLPFNSSPNSDQYMDRIARINKVKKTIEAQADGIYGSIVSVWFYNNGHIGPQGLEKGQQIAYQTISPVYDQVKTGKTTMQAAGQVIASNKNLSEIDPAYDANAFAVVYSPPGKPVTFWPEFNKMFENAKPGSVTPLYLAQTSGPNGNLINSLYIFGQVDKKVTGQGYTNYQEWLALQKQGKNIKNYNSSLTLWLADSLRGNWEVLAQEDNTSGIQHTTPEPGFQGTITSQTGAPIPGATVTFGNGCAGAQQPYTFPTYPVKYFTETDASGNYSQSPMAGINCGCNNQFIRVYTPAATAAAPQTNLFGKMANFMNDIAGVKTADAQQNLVLCGEVPGGEKIPNVESTQTVPVYCGPPGQPTPPPPVCDSTCYACGTYNGCGNYCGACPTPTPTPTPTPPPACNDSCNSDLDCSKAVDGCTSCLPNDAGTGNVCRPPAACNVACTRDGQCAGAKDGCTACVGGVCKPPPACGTACTTKADCAGAKDNCSECLEGTCTNFSDNMCKCDGITADMVYPGNSFNFEAFGKVEGGDVKKAEIADITFRMTKDNQVVAKSDPITPTVVENSANKMRFKAAWSTPPPPISANSTYRVFADVRCKPKRIVASGNDMFSPNPNALVKAPKAPVGLQFVADKINQFFDNKNAEVKAATDKLLALFATPTVNAQTSLQLTTLNFVKLTDTDNCRFVMFKFDSTLF